MCLYVDILPFGLWSYHMPTEQGVAVKRKKALYCQPAEMPADLYTSLLIRCCNLLVCLDLQSSYPYSKL